MIPYLTSTATEFFIDMITREPIFPEHLIGKVKKDEYGAIVTFIGTIRDTTQGRKVAFLQISPHGKEAESKLREVVSAAKQKWQLHDIVISRRVGKLKVGEVALIVAVAAPHRYEAFQACQYIVDKLKKGEITTETEIYEINETR
ncbi:MAG: molybdenum cofactor biosynthesis protein MoaE [Chloroflexi bacterium]|nr:molybdenum cofactor biosynthesis protein MoaE [Chloroflexota bacterium]MBM3174382.1 molybdenum cofactor biosynthesis protein MoaE [Chloroflexota bacterium]